MDREIQGHQVAARGDSSVWKRKSRKSLKANLKRNDGFIVNLAVRGEGKGDAGDFNKI